MPGLPGASWRNGVERRVTSGAIEHALRKLGFSKTALSGVATRTRDSGVGPRGRAGGAVRAAQRQSADPLYLLKIAFLEMALKSARKSRRKYPAF